MAFQLPIGASNLNRNLPSNNTRKKPRILRRQNHSQDQYLINAISPRRVRSDSPLLNFPHTSARLLRTRVSTFRSRRRFRLPLAISPRRFSRIPFSRARVHLHGCVSSFPLPPSLPPSHSGSLVLVRNVRAALGRNLVPARGQPRERIHDRSGDARVHVANKGSLRAGRPAATHRCIQADSRECDLVLFSV